MSVGRNREAAREVSVGTLYRTGNGWSTAGPQTVMESWTGPRHQAALGPVLHSVPQMEVLLQMLPEQMWTRPTKRCTNLTSAG